MISNLKAKRSNNNFFAELWKKLSTFISNALVENFLENIGKPAG